MVEAGSKHCGLGASTGPTRGDSQSAMFQANFDHFKIESKDKSSVEPSKLSWIEIEIEVEIEFEIQSDLK